MPDRRAPDSATFHASISRLQAPGLIGMVVHDEATGEGRLSFSPSRFRLPHAGRSLSAEPGRAAAWMIGDPLVVRTSVEREVAVPDGQTAEEDADTTDGSGEQRGSR